MKKSVFTLLILGVLFVSMIGVFAQRTAEITPAPTLIAEEELEEPELSCWSCLESSTSADVLFYKLSESSQSCGEEYYTSFNPVDIANCAGLLELEVEILKLQKSAEKCNKEAIEDKGGFFGFFGGYNEVNDHVNKYACKQYGKINFYKLDPSEKSVDILAFYSSGLSDETALPGEAMVFYDPLYAIKEAGAENPKIVANVYTYASDEKDSITKEELSHDFLKEKTNLDSKINPVLARKISAESGIDVADVAGEELGAVAKKPSKGFFQSVAEWWNVIQNRGKQRIRT
ncbi:hypothetical protein ACFLZZ_03580 [Nanoarchaeota archaeon]